MATEVEKKSVNVARVKASPNQSLYIQNLQQKRISKDDLRSELYMFFSTYGSVLAITTLKSNKMRGQAHVLFKDIETATRAMQLCQGQDFHGRKMKISYSANRSKQLAVLTGTTMPVDAEPAAPETSTKPSAIPAPPSSKPLSVLPPPPGLPTKPAEAQSTSNGSNTNVVAGRKHSRDESDDENGANKATTNGDNDEEEEDDDDDAMDMSESDEE